MSILNRFDNKEWDFKPFPGRTDIQVSKTFTAKNGDKIRAIVTSSNTVILTAVGNPNGNTIIFTGDPGSIPTDPVIYRSWWDATAEVAKQILERLFKGQNCTPVTKQKIETHKDGTVTITTESTIDCNPPK